MGKRRSKLEIIMDMLDAIVKKSGEIKPTHLMYKANLSYNQMQSYLERLIENEFVERIKEDENKNYIKITKKGRKYSIKLKETKEFQDALGL
ncbi:MAG: DUF4364 family protein [Candidatus Woesearchaeota archaeon]